MAVLLGVTEQAINAETKSALRKYKAARQAARLEADERNDTRAVEETTSPRLENGAAPPRDAWRVNRRSRTCAPIRRVPLRTLGSPCG